MGALASTVRITAVAFVAFLSPFANSSDAVTHDDLVAACRLAATEGGYSQYAAGPASLSGTGGGRVVVYLEAVDCTFGKTGELVSVIVTGCDECGIWYDDDLLARINRAVKAERPPS